MVRRLRLAASLSASAIAGWMFVQTQPKEAQQEPLGAPQSKLLVIGGACGPQGSPSIDSGLVRRRIMMLVHANANCRDLSRFSSRLSTVYHAYDATVFVLIEGMNSFITHRPAPNRRSATFAITNFASCSRGAGRGISFWMAMCEITNVDSATWCSRVCVEGCCARRRWLGRSSTHSNGVIIMFNYQLSC